MDTELSAAESRVHLAIDALHHRQKRLDGTRSKTSRHYSRLAHTKAMIVMLSEVLDMVAEDPDNWKDEEEQVPF